MIVRNMTIEDLPNVVAMLIAFQKDVYGDMANNDYERYVEYVMKYIDKGRVLVLDDGSGFAMLHRGDDYLLNEPVTICTHIYIKPKYRISIRFKLLMDEVFKCPGLFVFTSMHTSLGYSTLRKRFTPIATTFRR